MLGASLAQPAGPADQKILPSLISSSPGFAPHPHMWLPSLPSSAPRLSLAEGRSGQVSMVSHRCDRKDPRPQWPSAFTLRSGGS